MNVRFTTKEVYAILLDMTLHSEATQTDQQGRRYLAFYNKTIAEIIDRTPSTETMEDKIKRLLREEVRQAMENE